MTVKANAAILFADIAGSMRLYQGLGDERASVVVARCIHTMSDMVRASAGTVVRVVGDEVLATFPHADAAADAAIAIQAAISNMPPELGRPLGIRVGMHFGEILQDGPELYGDAVNVAARMVGQAKAGEILLTGSTAATLKGQAADMARTLGPIDIKGHTEAIEICEIVWKSEEATMMFRAPSASAMERRPVMPRVAFEHAGGRTVMTDHRSTLTWAPRCRASTPSSNAATAVWCWSTKVPTAPMWCRTAAPAFICTVTAWYSPVPAASASARNRKTTRW